jgi:hypothetical protein
VQIASFLIVTMLHYWGEIRLTEGGIIKINAGESEFAQKVDRDLISTFLCATSVFLCLCGEFSRQILTTEAQRSRRTHRDFDTKSLPKSRMDDNVRIHEVGTTTGPVGQIAVVRLQNPPTTA